MIPDRIEKERSMQMTLVRWKPSNACDRYGLDKFFEGFFPAAGRADSGEVETTWSPRTDIAEKKDGFWLEIDLPGLEKDDIQITVQENRLEITGERNRKEETEEDGYRRYERSHGSFRRVFRLPRGTDSAKIESTYNNGVLQVRIPKSEEALPRQIEVKVR